MAKKYKRNKYHSLIRDEILYLFDILSDNTIDNISNLTGADKNLTYRVLENYKNIR